MDRVIDYKYGTGTLTEVRKGRPDKKEIDGMDIYNFFNVQREAIIILPRVAGIYQTFDVVFSEPICEQAKQFFEKLVKGSYAAHELKSKVMLESLFGIDRAAPDLIHVVYDYRLMPEQVVREFLGDGLGRIALSDWRKLPDFREKSTEQFPLYFEQVIHTEEEVDEDNFETVLKQKKEEARRASLTLSEQLKKYGLTRDEYAFLKGIEIIRDFEKDRKIISGKALIPEILPFFLSRLIQGRD